jgi:hypothetical protein
VFKRKVITRSGARIRGYFASVKSQCLIPWESPLEEQALIVAEFDPRVVRMRDHQYLIEVEAEAGAFDAYPDFIFEYENEDPVVIEVKGDKEGRDPEVQARLADVARQISLDGGRYEIWPETEIRRAPRLSTLEYLRTFRRPRAGAYLIKQPGVTELLRWAGAFPLLAAAQRLRNRPLVMQLLANDLLHVNFDQPLCDAASLTVNEGALHAHVSH